jgi:hypothetical protein
MGIFFNIDRSSGVIRRRFSSICGPPLQHALNITPRTHVRSYCLANRIFQPFRRIAITGSTQFFKQQRRYQTNVLFVQFDQAWSFPIEFIGRRYNATGLDLFCPGAVSRCIDKVPVAYPTITRFDQM